MTMLHFVYHLLMLIYTSTESILYRYHVFIQKHGIIKLKIFSLKRKAYIIEIRSTFLRYIRYNIVIIYNI